MKRKVLLTTLLLSCVLISCQQSTAPAIYANRDAAAPPAETCTSFCLDSGGYCIFGANQDNEIDAGLLFVNKRHVLKTGWDPSTSGEYARWISRYGSVTVVHAGYQMAWAGINEAGLMFSTMALGATENPASDETPPLVGSFWAQYQLDNHSTVAEVIASGSEVRIVDTVDHYLFCDRTGECAVIEFLDGEMVYHTGDSLPVSALANSTYEESLATWEEGWTVPGLSVLSLEPGCPLERAGIEVGDMIVAVDGVEIELGLDVRELFSAMFASHHPGDEVEMTIIRQREEDPFPVLVELTSRVNDEGEEVTSLGHLSLSQSTSPARFGVAAERLASFAPASAQDPVAYAFDTLEAVSQPQTAWSIVLDPASRRMYFRTHLNPQIRYVDLDDLDLSCSSPTLMIDIHAAGAGDISDRFQVYSHDVSLAHTLGFFEQYQRLDYPPFLIDILLGGLERFPCAEDRVASGEDLAAIVENTEPLLPTQVRWAVRWALAKAWPVWLPLTILSLAFVVWQQAARQELAGRGLVWVLVTILLGPLGLLAYLVAHRKRRGRKVI